MINKGFILLFCIFNRYKPFKKDTVLKYLIFTLTTIFLISCDNDINTKSAKQPDNASSSSNLTKEIIYHKINDLEIYKEYEEIGSGIIDNLGNDEFGIHQIRYGNKNIIIFEKIGGQSDNIKYKLLDTLVIEHLDADEYISYQLCRKDTIENSEIIAILKKTEDKQYYDRILKAWKADRKSNKIIPIDTKGIDCFNEGYGAD